MHFALDFHCDQHANPFECPDALIYYSEKYDEYGLIIHDGGPSYIPIFFCPFCGQKLPLSQRERWFDAVEALGIDPHDDEALPEKYKSSAWRMPERSN